MQFNFASRESKSFILPHYLHKYCILYYFLEIIALGNYWIKIILFSRNILLPQTVEFTELLENAITLNNFPWNQLFSNFFRKKNVDLTEKLLIFYKIRDRFS